MVVSYYSSPKDVINYSDKESGIILIKSIFSDYDTVNNTVLKSTYFYDLKLQFKNNKYKYSISNLKRDMNLSESKLYNIEQSLLFDSSKEENKKYMEARRQMKDNMEQKINEILYSLNNFLVAKQDF